MDIMLQRILELIGDKHGATKQLAEALKFPLTPFPIGKVERTKATRRKLTRLQIPTECLLIGFAVGQMIGK